MNALRLAAMVLAVLLAVSSCATMFHGSKETISVRSDEPDTRFFLNERDLGRGYSAVTTIPKSKLSDATLRATKAGCIEKSAPVETQLDGFTFLGLLLDYGLFTILVFDWAGTGAVRMAAQNDYVLTPECPRQTAQ